MDRTPRIRRRRPVALHVLVVGSGLLLLTAGYLGAMRATIDLSRTDASRSIESRDLVYLVLHTGLALASVVLGFVAGKFLSGLGLAYAALFVAFTLVLMAAVQMGSFALACEGHNDLVRHWTC